MDNQLFTTNELATRLGVQPGTIRSWNSRYSDQIQEGTHFIKEGTRKLWTVAALQLFQTATENAAPGVAACVAPLQPIADAIAWEVIAAQLPGQVEASITRILTNPTELDQQRLLQILGQVGAGVSLARMAGIFAGGLRQAIAAGETSLKALGASDETD